MSGEFGPDGSDFVAAKINPELDSTGQEKNAPETIIEAGKLAIYHSKYGNELVKVQYIEGDVATIYPDVTDQSNVLTVNLESLSPVPRSEGQQN